MKPAWKIFNNFYKRLQKMTAAAAFKFSKFQTSLLEFFYVSFKNLAKFACVRQGIIS